MLKEETADSLHVVGREAPVHTAKTLLFDPSLKAKKQGRRGPRRK